METVLLHGPVKAVTVEELFISLQSISLASYVYSTLQIEKRYEFCAKSMLHKLWKLSHGGKSFNISVSHWR